MKKKHEHQIILLENRKEKKIIKRGRCLKSLTKTYKKLVKESEDVIFPQNYTSTEKNNKKIVHQLALATTDLSQKEYLGFKENSIQLERTDLIVTSLDDYHVEEKFFMYPMKKQKNYYDIIKELEKTKGFLTCYQIHNKIIFETMYGIENLIVCKNINDALMLYNIFDNSNDIAMMCIGKMSRNNMKLRAKAVMDRFNISYKRFYNTSTKTKG